MAAISLSATPIQSRVKIKSLNLNDVKLKSANLTSKNDINDNFFYNLFFLKFRFEIKSFFFSFWSIFYSLNPDPHISADPDPRSQNLKDPTDPHPIH